MNSTQDISDLKPPSLSGVLICDALMLRDEIVGINPQRTATVLANGQLKK